MLKSRTGYDQSVQIVTCAICGKRLVFVIVNRVVEPVPCAAAGSTSEDGSRRGGAGVRPVVPGSGLFVVAGWPVVNVSLDAGTRVAVCRSIANADPAIRRVAAIAKTKSFLILFSYTPNVQKLRTIHGHPLSTIRSPPAPNFDLFKAV